MRGRQQEAGEDRDDSDHDQELDERERGGAVLAGKTWTPR